MLTICVVEVDNLLVKYGLTEQFSRYSLYKTLFELYGLIHAPRDDVTLDLEYATVARCMYYSKDVSPLPRYIQNVSVREVVEVIVYKILPIFIDHIYTQLSIYGEEVRVDTYRVCNKWKVAYVNLK